MEHHETTSTVFFKGYHVTDDRHLPVVVPAHTPTKAYETIIITNLSGQGPMSKAMVFQIPPTIHEHNVVTELLKRLRVEWPGAWYCVHEWERNLSRPTTIGAASKVKTVTREHLGLPADDPITDVPV